MKEFVPGKYYRWKETDGCHWMHDRKYLASAGDRIKDKGGKDTQCGEYTRSFFEPVKGEKAVPKNKKEVYTFKVSSEKAIDLEEIYEGLSRKNPIAIVKRSDGMHTVIIHESLLAKAAHVDEAVAQRVEDAFEPYEYTVWVPLDSHTLTPLLSALRQLKNAAYAPPYKGSIECEVELLSL